MGRTTKRKIAKAHILGHLGKYGKFDICTIAKDTKSHIIVEYFPADNRCGEERK